MRLPKFFHADLDNIHHAAFWLAAFGILADILGLFRDRLLAGTFGASRELDIYYAAFRVPDFIYTLLLLFSASTAIIPVFLDKIYQDKKRAEELIGSVIFFFSAAMIIMSVIALAMMPWLIKISLPGFSRSERNEAVLLSNILLFSPLFLGLSNILSGVTQSFKRFFVYGLSPVFYNIGVIAGILFFLKIWGLPGLAAGVALGAFLHMFIQIPSLINLKVSPKFSRLWGDEIKKVLKLSFPRTMGLQVTQISSIIFTGIASVLAPGSIAIFNLASNLEYIPVTVIGLSYGVAAFPSLAKYSLTEARANFEKYFGVAFRHIVFWALPFSALLMVLRAQIVRVVLGSGAFSWTDTRLTAASLFLLSLAVIFQSLFMLLVRAFYAEGEAWRPLAINIVSMALGVGVIVWFIDNAAATGFLNSFMAGVLRLSDIADIRVIALSMGILAGSIVNFLFLYFAFKVIFGWFPTKGSGRAVLEIAAGSAVGALAAYLGLGLWAPLVDLHTFWGVFLQGLFGGIMGILGVLATLWILQNRELREVAGGLKSMRGETSGKPEEKHHVPAPEPEKLP